MVVGIYGNPNKGTLLEAVANLIAALGEQGLEFLISKDLKPLLDELNLASDVFVNQNNLKARVQLLFSFGGDGTMLAAGRLFAGTDIPVLGVNLGRLGFLAEFSSESIGITLKEFIDGKCQFSRRTLLAAKCLDDSFRGEITALNDIVIDKRNKSLLLQLETKINGELLGVYNADGLIIATPTGSTAYSLAVGGPVVEPSSDVFVIAPIAPHTLTARPVVVSNSAIVKVRCLNQKTTGQIGVYGDGQEKRSLKVGAQIEIRKYEKDILIVKSSQTTYWDILRAKLLWGREPILDIKNG